MRASFRDLRCTVDEHGLAFLTARIVDPTSKRWLEMPAKIDTGASRSVMPLAAAQAFTFSRPSRARPDDVRARPAELTPLDPEEMVVANGKRDWYKAYLVDIVLQDVQRESWLIREDEMGAKPGLVVMPRGDLLIGTDLLRLARAFTYRRVTHPPILQAWITLDDNNVRPSRRAFSTRLRLDYPISNSKRRTGDESARPEVVDAEAGAPGPTARTRPPSR